MSKRNKIAGIAASLMLAAGAAPAQESESVSGGKAQDELATLREIFACVGEKKKTLPEIEDMDAQYARDQALLKACADDRGLSVEEMEAIHNRLYDQYGPEIYNPKYKP